MQEGQHDARTVPAVPDHNERGDPDGEHSFGGEMTSERIEALEEVERVAQQDFDKARKALTACEEILIERREALMTASRVLAKARMEWRKAVQKCTR